MTNFYSIFVENSWKNLSKTLRFSIVKLCEFFILLLKLVEKFLFPPTFPCFNTTFPTTIFSLSSPNFFHFSTEPIITIINK